MDSWYDELLFQCDDVPLRFSIGDLLIMYSAGLSPDFVAMANDGELSVDVAIHLHNFHFKEISDVN